MATFSPAAHHRTHTHTFHSHTHTSLSQPNVRVFGEDADLSCFDAMGLFDHVIMFQGRGHKLQGLDNGGFQRFRVQRMVIVNFSLQTYKRGYDGYIQKIPNGVSLSF